MVLHLCVVAFLSEQGILRLRLKDEGFHHKLQITKNERTNYTCLWKSDTRQY